MHLKHLDQYDVAKYMLHVAVAKKRLNKISCAILVPFINRAYM